MRYERMVAMAMMTLLAAPLAWAGSVERDVELESATKVKVRNVAGEIIVETWDESRVWYHAELGEDCTGVVAQIMDGVLDIEVKVKKGSRGSKNEATLRVKVPAASDLAIESLSASVNVKRPRGSLDVETASGEITCEFVGARVMLSSVSGDVRANCEADQVDLRTASGALTALVNAASLRAESVSGDIRIEGEQSRATLSSTSGEVYHRGEVEQLQASSVSGDVRVNHVTSRAELFTTSGDVTAAGEGLTELRAESIGGDIRFRGKLSDSCVVELSSKSGDVMLALPEETPARFDLRSFSGNIGGALTGDGARREGPGKSVEYSHAAASAQVTVKSFSGDIRIEPFDAAE